jgi:hypothetical protein|tara:strand:+ start:994 stop:2259 length:1266 start_codon:yes stop_codon:yes gene_type:complete
MAFFFSRDTKVFMKWAYDSNNTALYELPVLDGYSFSQATNTSEVTLSEAANSSGYSKRGRAMFTDSFAPAEWSFSTYIRPTTSDSGNAAASNQHAGDSKKFAVEGPLWAAMSANTYDNAIAGSGGGKVFDSAASTYEPNVFDFQNSNQVALGVFDLFFVLGAAKDSTTGLYETGQDGVTVYKLANCSVGSASIDFDIEGIAQVAWSGQGQTIEEAAALNTGTSATNDSNSQSVAAETTDGLINEGISSTSNYVRNKLTDLAIVYDHANTSGTKGLLGSSNTTYSVTLTGGNITIENNLTYLTPETLGSVNLPLGHVMGTRSVSGNFTCYLNDTSEGSLQLFEDLQESRGVITNAFDLTFGIGGSASTPRLNVEVAKAHLELPSHSIEDVISVDVAFHGLPKDLSSGTKADATNEIKLTYTS